MPEPEQIHTDAQPAPAPEARAVVPTTTLEPVGAAAPAGEPTTAVRDEGRGRLGIFGWSAIVWLVLVVALALLVPVLPLDEPNEIDALCARQGFGTEGHVLGCDGLGRDLLSRITWGARASLLIGVASIGLGFLVGGLLGLAAGYFRRRVDTVLTGLFDVLLSFPQLILALTLVTVFATGGGVSGAEGGVGGVSSTRRIVVLILALGLVSVPLLGRITRANTLAWSQREFVLAARAVGVRDRRIMFTEVLPNVLPAMFSIALLGVAIVIVAEGGLSLLGVGVQLPTPSWGNIISEGRTDLRSAPHIVMYPTIVIFLTVLALNYLGDVVRARFDVRESAL
ncbi:MAG TPA: ABC transporter permease [Acidimicrobiales bacterium]